MNEKEVRERLLKMEEQIMSDYLYIRAFIWQNQEGQKDHLDNFNKSQKIAFIELYSKMEELRDCLKHIIIGL